MISYLQVELKEGSMSHRYIVSSTPYLKESGRPIYKVPCRGNLPNPNNMENGPVNNLIQLRVEEQSAMSDIIIIPPQEEVESEPTIKIIITPIAKEVRKPIKTYKVRAGNKSKVVEVYN